MKILYLPRLPVFLNTAEFCQTTEVRRKISSQPPGRVWFNCIRFKVFPPLPLPQFTRGYGDSTPLKVCQVPPHFMISRRRAARRILLLWAILKGQTKPQLENVALNPPSLFTYLSSTDLQDKCVKFSYLYLSMSLAYMNFHLNFQHHKNLHNLSLAI